MQEYYIKLIEPSGLVFNKIINIYPYGSVNYDTMSDKSDLDYIVVYECEPDVDSYSYTFEGTEINLNVMSREKFEDMLIKLRIEVCECLIVPHEQCYITVPYALRIDLDALRRAISSVCSNSYVKCKKKLKDSEPYIGKKSLFHSLRIADLGIQLANEGTIVNFTKPYSETLAIYDSFNTLLREIMSLDTWDELNSKYKPIANAIRTEFRAVAPLNN